MRLKTLPAQEFLPNEALELHVRVRTETKTESDSTVLAEMSVQVFLA